MARNVERKHSSAATSYGKWKFLLGIFFILFEFLYYAQQKHNYFTNYHTATCFDTIVSS